MLGKKSPPVIGKLAGAWGSGNRTGLPDSATSPRSPLEVKIQSPRGLKNYDHLGGVGLGIVAALEKSGEFGCEIRASKAVFGQNLTRSNPIPVKSHNNSSGRHDRGDLGEVEWDDLEDYTFVTCHEPNKAYTRVYCDGDEYGRIRHDRIKSFDRRSKNGHGLAVFDISPAKFAEDFTAYPGSDFLSFCHLCRKKLHGKDIYMYRGEKAFCSKECRYRQIVMEERKEQCRSEASRSSSSSSATAAADRHVSKSPYTNDQIFSTGILAI